MRVRFTVLLESHHEMSDDHMRLYSSADRLMGSYCSRVNGNGSTMVRCWVEDETLSRRCAVLLFLTAILK